MKLETKIDVTPIQNAFKRLQKLGQDTTPITRGIAAVLASESEDALARETDPSTGKKWKPLSPRYKAGLDARGLTGLMLQRSQGGLAMSLSTTYDATTAAIGSNKVYAALHQWGGLPTMPAAPAAVVARPYMGLSPQGVADIVDIIRQKHEEASRQR
ncbi:phage virion morphogenesis protein [Providencia rettgeri]